MKVRHPIDSLHGQPPENAFIAYDEQETPVGECSITPVWAEIVYPERPLRLHIRINGHPQALDVLLGAATARALLLIRQLSDSARARIYTDCAVDDQERLQSLESMGFIDDDELVRMRCMLRPGPVVLPLPAGHTIVRDALEDEIEQRFFLERYNKVLGKDKSEAWLHQLSQRQGFFRLLMVDRDGLAGELIGYEENNVGVIRYLFTEKESRRQKVGSYLIEIARQIWVERGIEEAIIDLFSSQQSAVRTVASCGYRFETVLMKHPGIDV